MACSLYTILSTLPSSSSFNPRASSFLPPKSPPPPRLACLGLRTTLPGRPLADAARTKHRSRRPRSVVVCEAQETITAAGIVTDASFRQLALECDTPVLVDFWAPWCGPCKMIAPLIDELARQYAGKLRCLKLNTDESPLTATQYGIRSIPTVVIFKNGEKVDTIIGAVPKSTLTLAVEKFIIQ